MRELLLRLRMDEEAGGGTGAAEKEPSRWHRRAEI